MNFSKHTDVEVWKDHPEWFGYEVSNMGRVRSYRKPGPSTSKLRDEPVILNGRVDQDGYIRYAMGGSRGKIRGGHQLVLETFSSDTRFEGAIALHKNNNDRSDNRLENLYWGTHADNAKDRATHGSLGLRLSSEDVREIRRLYRIGFNTREIARVYKTTQAHVSNIVSGKVRNDA